ncbi:NAD-dependent epimerase/dehydratase family protein [Amycolatopsis sp. NPDC059021]|uniref:NAD-dependent epimerase/dehydratase family protein n=1 Tax=Amycolatopsis sp. NPDC059021 TaxID=3346704 RepID=UPI00367305CA
MGCVLITGASGRIGGYLRTRLREPGRTLRLLDTAPAEAAAAGEDVEIMTGSVTDAAVLAEACAEADAVIHLAGHPREHTWREILTVNVDGTRTVLEAARRCGVPRVILASSGHVVGFRENEGILPADSSPRPDTYYGFGKAVLESLGSLYHSRFGMDVICVRIGACFPDVGNAHGMQLWLSPDDAGRLFEACLTAPEPGYRIVWGVSANTRGRCSPREAAELGYRAADDSERFAGTVPADDDSASAYLGGTLFVTTELGVPMR